MQATPESLAGSTRAEQHGRCQCKTTYIIQFATSSPVSAARNRTPSGHVLDPYTVTAPRRRSKLPDIALCVCLAELEAICCGLDLATKWDKRVCTALAAAIRSRATVWVVTRLHLLACEPLLVGQRGNSGIESGFFLILCIPQAQRQGPELVPCHRLLVDCDHFCIQKHFTLNRREVAHVGRYQQWRARHCPDRKLRSVLFQRLLRAEIAGLRGHVAAFWTHINIGLSCNGLQTEERVSTMLITSSCFKKITRVPSAGAGEC